MIIPKKSKKSRISKTLFNKKLLTYTTLAGGAIASSQVASGMLITNFSSFTVGSGGSAFVTWDINSDVTTDFTIETGTYFFVDSIFAFAPAGTANRFVQHTGSLDMAQRGNVHTLPNSFIVDTALATGYRFLSNRFVTFTGSGIPQGGINIGTQNIGFKFDAQAGPGTFLNFGWANITIAPGSLTINHWTYDDTGLAVHVPPIPEPGSMAYLIAGYAGLVEMRRRRNARTEARTADMG